MKQSPIFARTEDFVLWLMPRTENFPRSQRFVLTKRLQDTVLDFQERILEAALSQGHKQAERLEEADITLAKVRFYLRLVHGMKWLKPGQYEHAARMVAEIGRLLVLQPHFSRNVILSDRRERRISFLAGNSLL